MAPRLLLPCTHGPKLTYQPHPYAGRATVPPCFISSRYFLSAQRDAGTGSEIQWTFLIARRSPRGWRVCRRSGVGLLLHVCIPALSILPYCSSYAMQLIASRSRSSSCSLEDLHVVFCCSRGNRFSLTPRQNGYQTPHLSSRDFNALKFKIVNVLSDS